MKQSDRSQSAQKNTDNQYKIWHVSYTAIAIWCWLIAVFLVRLWVFDRVPDTYKAQVFIESILTLAIVDVVVVHAVMYYKQAKEANRQAEIALKQIEITDRPWIKFQAIVRGGIFFFENGQLSTEFRFIVRNVGRSVAVNATIRASLVIPEFRGRDQEVLKRQLDVCAGTDQPQIPPEFRDRFLLSYIVFPNEDYQINHGFNASADEVKRGDIGGLGLYELYLVGCVDYQIAGHAARHHTRFAYMVFPHGREGKGFLEIGENVPPENLVLHKLMTGGDYAD
jgi:hypothetical protein